MTKKVQMGEMIKKLEGAIKRASKLKETIEEKEDVKENIPSQKPHWTEGKSALMALGYIGKPIEDLLPILGKKIGYPVEQVDLETNMKEAYDKGNILYYEYDEESNLTETKSFLPEKTIKFAIDTGYDNKYGDRIYAQYDFRAGKCNGVFFFTKREIENRGNTYLIGLLSFKNYDAANQFIIDLEEDLLPGETWGYGKNQNMMRPKTKFEILESYLMATTLALKDENDKPDSKNYGKIRFSQDRKYALFNTGLLSKYATDILIVGEVHGTGGTFNISNPRMLVDGKYELQKMNFDENDVDVKMFSYFSDLSQIAFDTSVEIDYSSYNKIEHCINDGIKRGRYPKRCEEYLKDKNYEKLFGDFKRAVEKSVKIAERNYKYIVPQYRIDNEKGNRLQFLMPIHMDPDNYKAGEPDFVLVLNREENYYKLETVLTLAMAYNNARVICKPEDTWLNPSYIDCFDDDDMNEN